MIKEYIIYYGTIIIAAIFAWLSQIFAKDKENKYKLNKVFFYLSAFILSITIGLRVSGVGVDDKTYEKIFYEINNYGFYDFFMSTKMEPGYLILNQIVSIFTNDFQVFLYIVSLIPILFFYKAIEYERKNVNFFLVIFLFGTLLYLYFFGIIRLFIATSIMAFAIRYIFEKNTFKYVCFVLIASLFHYSALFTILLVYFSSEKDDKPRSMYKFILITSILMPILIFVISQYIIPLLGESKFESYTDLNTSGFAISLGDLDKVPFFILAIIFKKDIDRLNGHDSRIYITMYALATVVAIFSKLGSSAIVRLQWYFMFALCILIPLIARTLVKTKFKNFIVLFIPLIIFYGIFYSYRIVFIQSTNECMTNYRNILFDKE